ncbi:MAG TPA: zinc ribbon domain-containing protein [Oculatellaceae cyanobacterium]
MSIFDDLVQGVGREVTKVQARSQEMLHAYNLQNQIKDIERKRTAKLLELGRMVCDKYVRGEEISEDVFKDKANEVIAFEHEIGILQAEIDQSKVASDPNASASAKAEAKAGFTPTPGYQCPRCQAPASRDKSFCPVCGESLKKSSSSSGDDIIDVEPNNN